MKPAKDQGLLVQLDFIEKEMKASSLEGTGSGSQ